MKKLMILTAMMALMALGAAAQNEPGRWTLTPRVGLNLARLTNPDIYIWGESSLDEEMEYENRRGLLVGAEAEYQLNRIVALSGGLFFSGQGAQLKENSVFRDLKVTLNYVNVPLTAKFYFASGLAFRTGLQLGFAAKRHVEDKEYADSEQWESYSDDDTWYRTFDLSLPLGLQFNVGNIQLDATYNFGLTNATKLDQVKMHNRVLQLTLGYRFEL